MYCTKFVPTEDKCTECKDGYEVKDGACEQICPGFQKECGNGMQPAKDAEGQAIVCSDEHPDYVKCERIPDAKVIPGCRDYTPDNQHCRVCEDWYALIDGGDTCDPQPHVPNCEKPFPNSGICQMCASGFEANEDGTACTRIPSGGDDPDPSEDDCDSLFEHDYGTTTIKGKTMKIDVPCEDYYNLCGQGGGHTRTAYPDGYGNDTDVFTGTSWSPSATPQTPRGHDVWLNEDTGKLESDAYYCGEFNGDEKDFQYVYINRVCKTESGKIYYKCYLRGEGMKYVTGCLEWETNEHGCKKCDTDAGYKIEGSGQFRYCTCPSGDCGGDTPPTPTDCKPYSELLVLWIRITTTKAVAKVIRLSHVTKGRIKQVVQVMISTQISVQSALTDMVQEIIPEITNLIPMVSVRNRVRAEMIRSVKIVIVTWMLSMK